MTDGGPSSSTINPQGECSGNAKEECRTEMSNISSKISNDSHAALGRSIRAEEQYFFDQYNLLVVRDRILSSYCLRNTTTNDTEPCDCTVCQFKTRLLLPHLPDMLFPDNSLSLSCLKFPSVKIHFNALDALCMIDTTAFPKVQVGPSKIWQKSRREYTNAKPNTRPFDWTFTSDYQGTVEGFIVKPTSERIDVEKLKKREPINFYSYVTLYEDELADHGCSEMTVRVRVMTTFFFLLCRFYLRVDNVMVRICDTRIFGEHGAKYLLREWSKREARISELSMQAKDDLFDPSAIWQHLPVIAAASTKLLLPPDESCSSEVH